MSETIVVGVDGSETAMKAAQSAARFAAGLGATLHVVTAYENEDSSVVKVGTDEFRFSSEDKALAVAQSVASKLEKLAPGVQAAAVQGKPAEILIEEARRLGSSTIVVGNRRMQGLGRLLGSVANDVAHHAPCDVYIVKTI